MHSRHFPPLPTSAYRLQRSPDQGARVAALESAINRSPVQIRLDDLDPFLDAAEAWIDRDVLRAHLLAEGTPPTDTLYVLAFVKDGGPVGPGGWTLLPPAESAARPVRCLVISTPPSLFERLVRAPDRHLLIALWAEWIRLHVHGGQDEGPGQAGDADAEIVEWITRQRDEARRRPGPGR